MCVCVDADISKVFVGTSVYTSLRNESVGEDNGRLREETSREENVNGKVNSKWLRQLIFNRHRKRDDLEKRHSSEVLLCLRVSHAALGQGEGKKHLSDKEISPSCLLLFIIPLQKTTMVTPSDTVVVHLYITEKSSLADLIGPANHGEPKIFLGFSSPPRMVLSFRFVSFRFRLVTSKSHYLRFNRAVYSWFSSRLFNLSSWEEV